MSTIEKQTTAAQWITQCVSDIVVKLGVSHKEAAQLLLREAVREINMVKER
jgi:hypothetical protein